MKTNNILIVGATSWSIVNFRGDLIKALIINGFSVFTAVDKYEDNHFDLLSTMGVTPLTVRLQRTGMNPLKDLTTIGDLKKIITKHHIELVIPYTIKPVIYSSIAARKTKTKVISLITGLGFSFSGLNFKSKILQFLNEILYKRYVTKNEVIIFQNKDDYQLFLDRNILNKNHKVAIVSGSGVNLDKFSAKNYPENPNETVSFLIVARLIKEKGIGLFIQAAKILKEKYPYTSFHVIGSAETSPSAIKLEELNAFNEQGILIYHGEQINIPEHLEQKDVYVLPSFYREGIPRSILEALAVGLPIITTDSPGCRETVLTKENGFLIAPNNLDELLNAMEYFILNTDKIAQMGKKSRIYAENRFDVNIINKEIVELVKEII